MVVSRAAPHCRNCLLKLVPSASNPCAIVRCFSSSPLTLHAPPSWRLARSFATSLSPQTTPTSEAGPLAPEPAGSDLAQWRPIQDQAREEQAEQETKVEEVEEEIAKEEDGGDDVAQGESTELQVVEDSSDSPWYLDVEPPRHSSHLFEPSPLPELPPDCPNLLHHLLTYASEELGLDDLKILDLREINPPPALGANLIMMFGTARSERHLHISAGRVVRWLRSKHGTSASADGRLGPNQLKTKLKRKRKKDALLGARGVRAKDDDDGIQTGWICVNLGPVGPKMGKVVAYRDADGKLSGFGGEESMELQTTLVLQMCTDAKRRDLELESLWQRSLEMSRDKAAAQLRAAESGLTSTTGLNKFGTPFRRRSYPTGGRGRRFFSQESLVRRSVLSGSPRPDDFEVLARKPNLSEDEKFKLCQFLRNDRSSKVKTLTHLRRYLDNLPPDEQKAHLSHGATQGGYVYLVNVSQDNLPPEDTFIHRQWLYQKAQEHSIPGQPFQVIEDLVNELCISGMPLPSRASFLNLLEAVLRPVDKTPVEKNIRLALKLMRNVEDRATHQPLIASDVITTLISGLSAHTNASDINQRDRVQENMYELLLQSKARCPNQEELVSLLRTFASQENWTRFWTVWGLPPLFGLPRTPRLYTYMFRRVAEANHQAHCQRAVRRCTEELVLERPKISLPHYPSLSGAIMACVRIADPGAELVLEQVGRMENSQLTPQLRQRARGEFVLLMAQLKEKSLFDLRGPARRVNQIGPSLELPNRDRIASQRAARDKRRKEQERPGVGQEVARPYEMLGR